MYPTRETKMCRNRLGELSRGSGGNEPIEEPVRRPPANEPPVIKRPPQNDPNEPAELPLQDPSPRLPRLYPRDSADTAEG